MIRVTGKTRAAHGLHQWLLAPLAALLLGSAMPATAQQGELAQVKRATALRAEPGESARSLAPLAAQDTVTRLAERRGPWVQVRTAAGATGWVHMFDLAPVSGSASGSATGATGADALRGLTGLFNRGSGSTTVSTSASGLRGLDAADLANAQPNTAAVKQMEALRQNESQARQFARGAALNSTTVEPLPAPPRPAAANPGGPAGPQEAQ